DRVRIQVRHLDLSDLTHLSAGYLANLLAVGLTGALGGACGLGQQGRGGRGLQDEGERTIRVDGYLSRNNVARAVSRASVVFLAEAHQVDAVASHSRTDRRRRAGFASLNAYCHYCFQFLCHSFLLSGLSEANEAKHPPEAALRPRCRRQRTSPTKFATLSRLAKSPT